MKSENEVKPKVTVKMMIKRCGCGKTEYEADHDCPNPTFEEIPVAQGEDGVWRPS